MQGSNPRPTVCLLIRELIEQHKKIINFCTKKLLIRKSTQMRFSNGSTPYNGGGAIQPPSPHRHAQGNIAITI